jgi:hypothetical protein
MAKFEPTTTASVAFRSRTRNGYVVEAIVGFCALLSALLQLQTHLTGQGTALLILAILLSCSWLMMIPGLLLVDCGEPCGYPGARTPPSPIAERLMRNAASDDFGVGVGVGVGVYTGGAGEREREGQGGFYDDDSAIFPTNTIIANSSHGPSTTANANSNSNALPDLTLAQVVRTKRCWLLFFSSTFLIGSGYTFTTNLNQICECAGVGRASVAVTLYPAECL